MRKDTSLFEKILCAFGDRVVRRMEHKAEARCPAHDDNRASLSLGVGDDGKILVKCHAGCSVESVCEAVGLKTKDLFPEKPRRDKNIVEVYPYQDENGKTSFEVVRSDPKGFWQRRPDGHGGHEWNIKGVRRIPYRLPELIAADQDELVFVCEGERDVDCLRSLGLTATCNPGGAGKWRREFNKPFRGRNVVIVPDNDEPGREHARIVAIHLHKHAASLKVAYLDDIPEGGDISDWVDRRKQKGAQKESMVNELRALVRNTPDWLPFSGEDGLTVGDGRIEIDCTEKDLRHLTNLAWDAIAETNDPPSIYRRGGQPARIVYNDDGFPEIQTVDANRMRCRLANIAWWYKVTDGGLQPIFPPEGVVKNLLASPELDLPVLIRIVQTPLFAQDGTLASQPGYNPSAKIYYEAMVEIPAVSEAPTESEIQGAKSLLTDDLLIDFPFCSHADRANALALLFAPFVREMISGATPLHLIEKPTPGTGATLLVECYATISTGRPATVLTEGREEEEWRKRITSSLRPGPTILFLDNLSRRLDSAALSAAITSRTWNDRLLGQSEILSLPVRCIWVATGNNPTTSAEISRRCIPIRLDAKVDQPWQRDVSNFKHENLKKWVLEKRAELIHAALTLIQHWIQLGKPVEESVSLGGFEEWAEVMGGILRSVGIPGFLDNLSDFYRDVDEESATWRSFVDAWWAEFGDKAVGVSQLWDFVESGDMDLDLGEGNERSRRTRLGLCLKRAKDRRFGGLRLESAGFRHGSSLWRLRADGGRWGPQGPPPPSRGKNPEVTKTKPPMKKTSTWRETSPSSPTSTPSPPPQDVEATGWEEGTL